MIEVSNISTLRWMKENLSNSAGSGSLDNRGNKLKLDVSINIIFSIAKSVCLFYFIRRIGMVFPLAVLGVYLLIRRLIGLIPTLSQMGMSQGILRYVSFHHNDPKRQVSYLISGILVCSLTTLLITGVMIFARNEIAGWVFPGYKGSNLPEIVMWTAILCAGVTFHFLAHSTLFARRRMIISNLMDLLNVAGWPLIALYWYGQQVTLLDLLRFQAIAMIAGNTLVLGIIIVPHIISDLMGTVLHLRESLKELFYYSIWRGQITVLDVMLVTLGPWLIRRHLDEVAALGISLILVKALQVVIASFNKVGSVITGRLLASNDSDSIRQGIRLLLGICIYLSLFVVTVLRPWSLHLLLLWLQKEELAIHVQSYTQIILLGLIPWTIFQGLKGIIEIRWTFPYNLVNLAIAISVYLILFWLLRWKFSDAIAVQYSFLTCLWVLGILTLRRIWPDNTKWRDLFSNSLIYASLVAVGLGSALAMLFPPRFGWIGFFQTGIGLIITVTLSWGMVLFWRPTPVGKEILTFMKYKPRGV